MGRPARARGLALYGDGLLAFREVDRDGSLAGNEAALAAGRAAGDREAESLALVGLSRVAFRDRDYDRVRELALRARALVHDLADPRPTRCRSTCSRPARGLAAISTRRCGSIARAWS